MAEKIVGLISCLLCAVPFLIIGIFEKNSKEPITFWSGDKTLKSKVKDVTAYNLEMGMLYQECAFAFMTFRNLLPDFVRLWDCDACFGLHGRGLSDVSKL
ncbi:MAG: hypothetical protein ACLU3U_14020 [Gallintestinimicrobium sp.]